jgi:hypothetical protein
MKSRKRRLNVAEITGLNGAALSSGKKATLTLEYELATGKLAVGGELGNLDLALNILAQATRYLENQYRNHQNRLFLAEQAQAERLARMIQQ